MSDWSENDVIAAADWARCDLVERVAARTAPDGIFRVARPARPRVA
jgi:hypothetical protein